MNLRGFHLLILPVVSTVEEISSRAARIRDRLVLQPGVEGIRRIRGSISVPGEAPLSNCIPKAVMRSYTFNMLNIYRD